MSQKNQGTQLTLKIDIGKDTTTDQLDKATKQIYRKLKTLLNDSTDLHRTADNEISKSETEVITIGVIILTLLPTFYSQITNIISNWLIQNTNRTVEVSKNLEDNTSMTIKFSAEGMSEDKLSEYIEEQLRILETSHE